MVWFVSTCISGANHPNSIYHNDSWLIHEFLDIHPSLSLHSVPRASYFDLDPPHLLCLRRCLLSSVVVGHFGDLGAKVWSITVLKECSKWYVFRIGREICNATANRGLCAWISESQPARFGQVERNWGCPPFFKSSCSVAGAVLCGIHLWLRLT